MTHATSDVERYVRSSPLRRGITLGVAVFGELARLRACPGCGGGGLRTPAATMPSAKSTISSATGLRVAGAMLAVDHVELRRWLVDSRRPRRATDYGRAYARGAPAPEARGAGRRAGRCRPRPASLRDARARDAAGARSSASAGGSKESGSANAWSVRIDAPQHLLGRAVGADRRLLARRAHRRSRLRVRARRRPTAKATSSASATPTRRRSRSSRTSRRRWSAPAPRWTTSCARASSSPTSRNGKPSDARTARCSARSGRRARWWRWRS